MSDAGFSKADRECFRLASERRSLPRIYIGCIPPVEPSESPFHELYERGRGIEDGLVWLCRQYADAAAGRRVDMWAKAAHSMIDLMQSAAERYYK
jgi:hypothetical protein